METAPERLFVEAQPRLRREGEQVGQGGQLRMSAFRGLSVIGADTLADIAAENPSMQFAFLARSSLFDGSAGDAAAGVQHPILA